MKYAIVHTFLFVILASESSKGLTLRGTFIRRTEIETTEKTEAIEGKATPVDTKNATEVFQDVVGGVINDEDKEEIEGVIKDAVANVDVDSIENIEDAVESVEEVADNIIDNVDTEKIAEVADAVNKTLGNMTKEELASTVDLVLEDEEVTEALDEVIASTYDVVDAFQELNKDEVVQGANEFIEKNDIDIDAAFEQVAENVDLDEAVEVLDNAIVEVVENEKVATVVEAVSENEQVVEVVEKLDATANAAIDTAENIIIKNSEGLGIDEEKFARQNACGETCVDECTADADATFAEKTRCNRSCMRACLSATTPTSAPMTASVESSP